MEPNGREKPQGGEWENVYGQLAEGAGLLISLPVVPIAFYAIYRLGTGKGLDWEWWEQLALVGAALLAVALHSWGKEVQKKSRDRVLPKKEQLPEEDEGASGS